MEKVLSNGNSDPGKVNNLVQGDKLQLLNNCIYFIATSQ